MNAEQNWASERLKTILSLSSLEASKMRELALKTKDVIKLTSGEPDFLTPDHIREAAKRALDEGNTFYTPTGGIPEFREAVAEKIQREQDVDLRSSEVIATPGAIQGIFLAIMGVIDPGDEVLVPDPCYVGYPSCIRFAGGIPVPVPLKEEEGFRLEPVEIERRISKASKMIILNSPSNPTGMVINRKDLIAIADVAKEKNLVVLTDEAYEKIVYDDVKHSSILSVPGMKERTILIGSCSKTYAMTGWRIGYLAAKKSLVDDLLQIQSSIVLCTNTVVQKAAVAALRGPQDCVTEMVKEFDKRRRFIVEKVNSIDGFTCQLPQGAFFVFPNVTEFGLDSLKMTQFLIEEAKVAVYPGIAYGNLGEGHIRLTYAASLRQIETALQRIEGSLEKLR